MNTRDGYRATKAINASAIKAGAKSLLHMHHALTHERKASPAMHWGTLVHAMLLEGPDQFAIFEGVKRGKAWDEFQAACPAPHIVSPDQMADLLDVLERVAKNPDTDFLCRVDAQKEFPLTWEEPGIGPCKALPDWFFFGHLVDVKNAKDIGERAYTASSWNAGTHLQFAWYRRGLKANGFNAQRISAVAIESAAPFDVALYHYDADLLNWSEKECLRICRDYIAAEKAGHFPGVQKFPTSILQPAWADEMVVGIPDDETDGSEL